MTKFPHLLAAVEAREKHLNDAEGKDLWAIGAAVIKDCNLLPAKDQYHSGTGKLLEAASKELAKHGYREYHVATLRNMATTTATFPANRRYSELSFNTHSEAQNPDILDWIVSKFGTEDLSKRDVRSWVKRWRTLQTQKKKDKITAAKSKKKTATTPEGKRAAQKELDELGSAMPTPKSHLPPPDEKSQSELAEMADIMKIDADAMTTVKTLRKNLAALYKMGEINPDFGEALIEHHEQVREVAIQIVNLLKTAKKNKYQIIEGGKSA